MADCQDLVNSVNAVDTTLQSILEEIQLSRAVLIEQKEAQIRIETHLGFRLTSRAFQREADTKLVEALLYVADSISERIAQSTQAQNGLGGIPGTDIPDIPAVDNSLDLDTPGGSPP